MLVFTYIEIEIGVDEKILAKTLRILMSETKEFSKRNILVVLPILVLGFQFFCQNKEKTNQELEDVLSEVKEFYQKYIKEEIIFDLENMLYSQVYKMNRYQKNEKYKEIRIKDYLEYLN